MSRSLYKLPYIHRSLWAKKIKARKNRNFTEKMSQLIIPYNTALEKNYYFWKRSSNLNNKLSRSCKTIGIYNGYAFVILYLRKNFSNYKLGQFILTRRSVRHKGKQRQKKKV